MGRENTDLERRPLPFLEAAATAQGMSRRLGTSLAGGRFEKPHAFGWPLSEERTAPPPLGARAGC